MNNEVLSKIIACRDYVRSITAFVPKAAVVLGSGLGSFANDIKVECVIEYKDIPDFPTSTVVGHAGRFVFGYSGGVPIVVMQGRVHYYEGYPITDVVLPIRLMNMLGATTLILTNASGAINKLFMPGDFMLITGHISLFAPNPLIGGNLDEFGTRFPDMTHVYDNELSNAVRNSADELSIKLHEGTYVQLTGPSYESPHEINMLRVCGADAVGMSTVCEAITARHAGMTICGISCIANAAAGLAGKALVHEDVTAVMDSAGDRLAALIHRTISKLA